MTRILFFFTLLFLSACGEKSFDLLERLAGIDTNTVVISAEPAIISEEALGFFARGNAVVVGETAKVCISLRGDFPHASQEESMAEYNRLLNGAQLTVNITTDAGQSFDMSRPSYSWSKYGVVMKNDEIATCAHLKCDVPGLEVGTILNQISVSASKPLPIQGLYWESTNRWDKAN